MRIARVGFVGGIFMVLGGCSDLGTVPIERQPVRLRLSISTGDSPHGPRQGASPYFCSASRAVAGRPYRFQYGVRPVNFPRPELAKDGSSTLYHVMSYGGGGEIAGRASCVIPSTDRAKARIERLFRASPRRSGGMGTGAEGGVTLRSEPTPIEGVDVYTCRYGGEYPHCNYEPWWPGQTQPQCSAYDPTCGTGGGGDPYDDGWSWGNGGDDSEPPDLDDGTGREPCRRGADSTCITRPIDARELQQIIARINAMEESPSECAVAKQYAQELVSIGSDRFRVWDGYDIYPDSTKKGGRGQRLGYNAMDAKGRILVFDSYWLFNDYALVAHEALHNYLFRINSPLTGNANEDWVEEWSLRCA